MDEHSPIASSSSSTSANNILPILLSLPLTAPSQLDVLKFHQPFSHPSHLNAGSTTKYLNRIHSSILGRDDLGARKAGCEIAAEVVRQDEEGWVLNGWGKGWVGVCLGSISTQDVILSTIIPPIALLEVIILEAKAYPGFERDAIQPILGKLSVTLSRLVERCIASEDRAYDVLYPLLNTIRTLLVHSPAAWRPSTPSLRTQLINLITFAPTPPSVSPLICPPEVRRAAADLLATTHLTSGKATSSATWLINLKDALGGLGACISAITQEGFREELRRVPAPPCASLPPLPTVPGPRLDLALEYMEGYTEIILSMLRFPSSRPVSVPIAALVSAGLRCLNLTLSTPVVEYITPNQHAALLACLPRIWTSGLLTLAATSSAVDDHLLPHLSEILDHAIFLADTTPSGMVVSHTQFLRFLGLMLETYPPSIISVEYTTRMLKMCLGRVGSLLDKRSVAPISSEGGVGGGAGRRGKKRARGLEDGLVGGLEGRSGDTIGEEAEIILESLKLIPLLHPAPLLPPALLTFSIRLHVSLYISLDQLGARFGDLEMHERIQAAVKHVLEEAVLLPEEEGMQRGWKSVIIGLLTNPPSTWSLLLHPSLPPLHRPAPPLSSLHMFAPEGEEEKKLRQEMGFSTLPEVTSDADRDGMGGDMDVDVDTGARGHGVAPDQGQTGRRMSISAEDLHVTHDPRQVVPTALITTPAEERKVVLEEPIIIDGGPTSSSQTKTDVPMGLSAGLAPLPSVPPVPSVPSAMLSHQVNERGDPSSSIAALSQSAEAPKASISVTQTRASAPVNDDDDDEEIPPLDSGSSDEGGEDDDDEE